MIKELPWKFHKCLGPFNMLTVEGCSDTVLFSELSNQVLDTRYFRKYISYDDLLFFGNVLKFNRDSINGLKKPRKYFLFLRQLHLNREREIFTIRNRTLVMGRVCVLKNTPMILNFNKGNLFWINSSQSDGKIWWKCSHNVFTSVLEPLTCWPSKDVLTRRFLVSGLTNF